MRFRSVAFLMVVLLGVVGGQAGSPAEAAPPSGPTEPGKLLQLSRNQGGPWADTLNGPLFGAAYSPMAPGDATETFWVFNTTGTRANLSLSCTVSPVPPEDVAPGSTAAEALDDFAEALDLDYRIGATGPFTGCGIDRCSTDQDDTGVAEVGGRKSRQVDVRLSFCGAGTAAMNQSAAFSITVTLSQIPPKGGKPQVLGSQTLAVGSEPAPTDTVADETTRGSSTAGFAPSASPVDTPRPSTVRTTKVAATLPENGAVTATLPLIGGLLVAGALLAGVRRRRPEAD